jgi:hypothetical protein
MFQPVIRSSSGMSTSEYTQEDTTQIQGAVSYIHCFVVLKCRKNTIVKRI